MLSAIIADCNEPNMEHSASIFVETFPGFSLASESVNVPGMNVHAAVDGALRIEDPCIEQVVPTDPEVHHGYHRPSVLGLQIPDVV